MLFKIKKKICLVNYFGKLDLITDSSIMSKDEYKKKICKKIQKKEKMFKSHFN